MLRTTGWAPDYRLGKHTVLGFNRSWRLGTSHLTPGRKPESESSSLQAEAGDTKIVNWEQWEDGGTEQLHGPTPRIRLYAPAHRDFSHG